MKGMPVLFLISTGRRPGKRRTVPLPYIRDGEAIVVVASNGGSGYVPCWWLNLRASPEAGVEFGRGRTRVRAREASSAEHARLRPEVTRACRPMRNTRTEPRARSRWWCSSRG